MKIAISSTGPDLESAVDNRFGRCAYFIIYDTETKNHEAITNVSAGASGGAGIQAAQNIKEKNAEIVLTGNVGPNAMATLSAAKIGVAVGVSGTVKEVIGRFQTGEYKLTEQANVSSHFGFKEE
ncbi:MAG: NifB/NifX family molybdenum-iron cluster-binding protein [Spirochaetes bacterium]|nr:NifB/NifX family molybdenum-iron cluster-binding protein [Spirochaetota bacterium]